MYFLVAAQVHPDDLLSICVIIMPVISAYGIGVPIWASDLPQDVVLYLTQIEGEHHTVSSKSVAMFGSFGLLMM